MTACSFRVLLVLSEALAVRRAWVCSGYRKRVTRQEPVTNPKFDFRATVTGKAKRTTGKGFRVQSRRSVGKLGLPNFALKTELSRRRVR